VSVSDGSRIVNGSEFHSVGPETAKHLWPYIVVLEHGTARSPVQQNGGDHDWLNDSDTGEHSSARYVGASFMRCSGIGASAALTFRSVETTTD